MILCRFFIFLIIFQGHVAAKAPEGWLVSRDSGFTKTWKLKGHKGVYLSKTVKMVLIDELTTVLQQKKYLKELNQEKSKLLSFVGIKSWKAKSSKWKKVKGYSILEVKGQYIDSLNIDVDFIENHIFLKNKVIRLLYVAPQKNNISNKHFQNFVLNQVEKL